jgi:hypothetical protein
LYGAVHIDDFPLLQRALAAEQQAQDNRNVAFAAELIGRWLHRTQATSEISPWAEGRLKEDSAEAGKFDELWLNIGLAV